jgi:sulfide:quinone oxidoreductase
MAKPRIVILGAGLGGAIAAFEIKAAVGGQAEVSVVSQGDTFHFVPSNPWVAVHWRKRAAIEVKLPPVFKKKGIAFTGAGARRVDPVQNRIELSDGAVVDYDYLVITPRRRRRRSTASSRTPDPSWSARSRAPPASARPTSSP